MPGQPSAAKYWHCSITFRKRMKGPPLPDVQNDAGEARQSLERAVRLNPIGICSNMYRVLNLAHRS